MIATTIEILIVGGVALFVLINGYLALRAWLSYRRRYRHGR